MGTWVLLNYLHCLYLVFARLSECWEVPSKCTLTSETPLSSINKLTCLTGKHVEIIACSFLYVACCYMQEFGRLDTNPNNGIKKRKFCRPLKLFTRTQRYKINTAGLSELLFKLYWQNEPVHLVSMRILWQKVLFSPTRFRLAGERK